MAVQANASHAIWALPFHGEGTTARRLSIEWVLVGAQNGVARPCSIREDQELRKSVSALSGLSERVLALQLERAVRGEISRKVVAKTSMLQVGREPTRNKRGPL